MLQMGTICSASVSLTLRKFPQMTNEPKLGPSAPVSNPAQPIAQPAQSSQGTAQEKGAPATAPVSGVSDPKKNV
jgi:hypothetical protein